ncbi:tripartite tricarboxylate transporter permease [Xinfangfangia pollutisoli]|uniref:tripartite tricarboxylate transporter permease n=1 Tax=Xinfangfangia pollutisoli TaxID=2865960 RepID=UPI001CD440C0|nr:tripartite tricarboxylate transporter permease [Xinfangfangia pollutisoli]
MDLLPNLALGLQVAFSPINLMYCLMGVTLGTAIGVLPGVGPIITISLLLPLTFGLPPEASIILLAGIYYGAAYGGSTTSILVNLPGEAASAVTCIDGHQMTRQGRAGSALAIAALGSFFAGTVGTLLIALAGPPLASIAIRFGAAEYAALVFCALITTASMTRGGAVKGIGVTLLGVIFGLAGADVSTGIFRFDFGILELRDGIDFAVLAVGLFAVAEIIGNIAQGEENVVSQQKLGRLWPTRDDFRRAWPAVLRGTGIGAVLGVLPGAGLAMSSFSAYMLEKSIAREPERFGKGAVEGVAAPESANNAASQTAFIPTLLLSVPGSPVMALMLGAFMIHGISPGPRMMTEHAPLFWGLVASMWVGNLMLVVLNLPLIGLWVRLLRVPYHWLFVFVLAFACVGVFSTGASVFDIYALVFFGLLGYLLKAAGCSPALFILGFILGPMFEEHFRRAMTLSRGDPTIFLQRPISLTFVLIGLAVLLATMSSFIRKGRAEATD